MATRNCPNCLFCNAPSIPRSPYCPPPARRHQGREHRAALRTAHDARLDVFRCQRSGVILVLDGRPLPPVLRQVLPTQGLAARRQLRALQLACGRPRAHRVPHGGQGAHRAGRPFHREAIGSGCWTGMAPCPPGRRRGSLLPIAGVRGLQGAGPRAFALLPALPRAAPGPPRRGDEGGVGPGGFGCRCTGVVLDEADPGAPGPSTAGTPVVAAWWVNKDRHERGDVLEGGH